MVVPFEGTNRPTRYERDKLGALMNALIEGKHDEFYAMADDGGIVRVIVGLDETTIKLIGNEVNLFVVDAVANCEHKPHLFVAELNKAGKSVMCSWVTSKVQSRLDMMKGMRKILSSQGLKTDDSLIDVYYLAR